MAASRKARLSEKEINGLWREMTRGQARLADSRGEPLTVLYPGRPNDYRGGDFRDAVVLFPEGRRQGQIELHTLTSGWQSHGHHRDPDYDQVILQVAWQSDRGLPACSTDGRRIATVLLSEQSLPPDSLPLACRGFLAAAGGRALEEVLEEAGRCRFEVKWRRLQAAMETDPVPEVLYQGLAGALGYTHNQAAFTDLARRLPLSRIAAETNGRGPAAATRLEAYLFGRAGLLPSQRGRRPPTTLYVRELESIWEAGGWTPLRPAPAWEFYRVRPLNHPVRRLAALAAWLSGGLCREWSARLLAPVRDLPPRPAGAALRQALEVPVTEYWRTHSDFDLAVGDSRSALLGRARLAETVNNVVLPFLAAGARTRGEETLFRRIILMYLKGAALPSNAVQRHMQEQLGLTGQVRLTAGCQQGLIHLYRAFCREGRCAACPLGGPEAVPA